MLALPGACAKPGIGYSRVMHRVPAIIFVQLQADLRLVAARLNNRNDNNRNAPLRVDD